VSFVQSGQDNGLAARYKVPRNRAAEVADTDD
jgi:hypothetical protein